MADLPSIFQDFGIQPEGAPPTSGKIRCFISRTAIVGEFLTTAIVALLGVGAVVLFALAMPLWLSLLGSAAAVLAFGVALYLATRRDFYWVELEDDTLRVKYLYTSSVVVRNLKEIIAINYDWPGVPTAVEIRFRNRPTAIPIMRTKAPFIIKAPELIQALLSRMQRLGELDSSVLDFGSRRVQQVYWKTEQQAPPGTVSPNPNRQTLSCLLMIVLLLLGLGTGYWGARNQDRHEAASVPPQELALHDLIQNGPGKNRHVTLTDFHKGGGVQDAASTWFVLFPAAPRARETDEIKVVVSATGGSNLAALQQMLQQGRVTGVCSKAEKTFWGAVIGPRLLESNPGSQLLSAWSVECFDEPPSAALAIGFLAGAVTSFVAAIVLAVVILKTAT